MYTIIFSEHGDIIGNKYSSERNGNYGLLFLQLPLIWKKTT